MTAPDQRPDVAIATYRYRHGMDMLEFNQRLSPLVGLLVLVGACAPAAPGFT